MDFDLAQVRAFVTAAEHLHFTRAAERLFLSQQALSKRIQRLEQTLGEPLFIRHHQAVELTEAGRRFLPHARGLLSAAEKATSAFRADQRRPLRIDVWGYVNAPLRLVRKVLADHTELPIELSMRRNFGDALIALEKGAIDVAFGRASDLERRWPDGITRQVVYLDRGGVIAHESHPIVGRPGLTMTDLAQVRMYWPFSGGPPEINGYFQRIVDHFELPIEAGTNMGLDHLLDQLRQEPTRVAFGISEWPLPSDVRFVPIQPVTCFPWSLAWRQYDPNPDVHLLADALFDTGRRQGWVHYDPARDWLSDVDLLELRSSNGSGPI